MRLLPSVRRAVLAAVLTTLATSGCGGPPDVNQAPLPTAPGLQTSSPGEFSTTESGLKYQILKPGDGPKPAAENVVTVNYRGWLDDGSEFDSGKDISFGLGQVISGWTEGLQLIGKGGKIELEIPPNLAYGDQAQSGIPANSTLHFEVELLEIK